MPSNKKLLQAAAGSAGGTLGYVEDVFSTFLYTGNGSTQTITNGIDLAGEGGLVWTKRRSGALNHFLVTTDIATNQYLSTDLTSASGTTTTLLTPASDGFAFSSNTLVNANTASQVAWTFRKAKKFFDVVTYTGTGDSAPGQTVAHNLGSTPGFMIIKRTDSTSDWSCYHSGLTSNEYYLKLNGTNAETEDGTVFPSAPTDSNFYVRADRVNASGGSFVAYLFASDAGGYGDDSDENIIKCGSYTGNNASTANVINVGFEPQWIMIKGTDRACNWIMVDVMRGATVAPSTSFLEANTSDAEATSTSGFALVHPTATGFSIPSGVSGQVNEFNENYIYIAIRRPMKTPESGTEVFGTVAGAVGDPNFLTSFPVDMGLWRTTAGDSWKLSSRLTGVGELNTNATTAEITNNFAEFDYMNGWYSGNEYSPYMSWMFKRATGFFDVVAYTGNNVEPRAIAHGLGVVPEMIIIKNRSGAYDWVVYHSGNTANPATEYLHLNANYATLDDDAMWKDTAPTASVFTTGNALQNNNGSHTYIAYLFATLAGVSKVGSYTGTGADLNVDCGFSAGARFILIKRTDSTGDWYVWDSLRGIVAGNDPYLLLNSTAAEVTSTDYIDPLSSGFTVTSSAPAGLNNSGGSYIFLAMA